MDFSKETILIVDDSHFQHTIIKELFQEYFNLIEATSGGECMRIIEEKTPLSIWCFLTLLCWESMALKYCAADRICRIFWILR